MSCDSHASKRKNLQPKKRSMCKNSEVLNEIKRKKKKFEESSSIPLEQKTKQIPSQRSKDKQVLPSENSSTTMPPFSHSGNFALALASHSNSSIKVLKII